MTDRRHDRFGVLLATLALSVSSLVTVLPATATAAEPVDPVIALGSLTVPAELRTAAALAGRRQERGAKAGSGTGVGRQNAATTPQRDPRSDTALRAGAAQAWTLGAEYVDTCEDTDGLLDLRRAYTQEDTHGFFAFATQTCAAVSPAEFGDGLIGFELYVPDGRGDGPDFIVATYDEESGTGEWVVEVVAVPSDDPSTWVTTYYGAAYRPDPYTLAGVVPTDVLLGEFEWAFDVFSTDAADELDVLPAVEDPLVAFPHACTRYTQSRRVVRVAPGAETSVASAAQAQGFVVASATPRLGVLSLARPGRPDDDADLAAIPGVLGVRAPVLFERAGRVVPTDPEYAQQWYLDAINAPDGWGVRSGSDSVVAVIDDGIDGTRSDLAGRVLAGRDTMGERDIPAGANSDLGGHGTAVTGVLAADGSDGLGMAGVDWTAQVVPYRVFDAAGCADDIAIATAITHAADNGADVINLSLGGPGSSSELRDAVAHAVAVGAVVVAASGNDADLGNPVFYPAAYPEVIGVGATTRAGRTSFFSTAGEFVDVSAPGGSLAGNPADEILTLGERDGFVAYAGTSFSSPIVAGAAALYLGGAPDATPAEVEAALRGSAQDLGLLGHDPFFGAGELRLDVLLRDQVDLLDVATTAVVSTVGGPIASAAVADADGDGLADLIVARGSAAAVFRGDGTGAFSAGGPAITEAARAVLALDVDGEGVDEVVVLTGTSVVVLARDGAGGLEEVANLPVGADPQGLTGGDVDGDGDVDLVLTAVGDAAVEVLVNDGNGAFVRTTVALGQPVVGPVTTHILGAPGARAGVVVRTDTELLHLVPDGLAYAAPVVIALNSTNAAVGDVDADHDGDVITVSASGVTTSLVQNGDRSLGPGTTSGTPSGVVTRRAIAAADLDGDGLTEVLVRGGAGGSVEVRRTSGDGRFSVERTVPVPSAAGVSGFAFGSVIGPGAPDVIALSSTDGRIGVIDVVDAAPPRVVTSPPAGRTRGPVTVRFLVADADPQVEVTYTTNGTTPTASSTVARGPITLSTTTPLRWRAVDRSGNVRSGSAAFVIDAPFVAVEATSVTDQLEVTTFAGVGGGADTSFTWRFGDGISDTGRSVEHTYTAAGAQRVLVTGVDLHGGWTVVEHLLGVVDGGRVQRVAGPARVETAVQVSQRFWNASTSVLVATADDFPDALAAGALANLLDAPLLLTPPSALPASVRAEIVRLGAVDITILGGRGAVSQAVEDELRKLGTVQRRAGTSRFATAAAIAEFVGPSPYGEVALARGDAFPDALSAGALAASLDRIPTLLTRRDVLPGETFDALERMGATRVFLIGGPGAIDPEIETALRTRGYEVVRLSGPDRFATSAAVAEEALHRFPFGEMPVTFATGTRFPDALSAAAASARLGGPLLLVPSDDLASGQAVGDFLGAWAELFDDGTLIGGQGAVSERVRQQLAEAARVGGGS